MIIDLSVHIDDRTPAYPGDPHFEARVAGAFEHDGYEGHSISMGTHTGTHIDAPSHMIPEGASLNMTDISRFVGRGRMVDATQGFSLDSLKLADIQAGDIVLFDTGTSARFYDASYFERYPTMPPDIAEYLVGRQVSMVGLDTCSADNTPGFPIHKILLSRDIHIIENLTNLAALAHQEFRVFALPLNLSLDGAPARVIAEIAA
ncbi:MAG: hypothetical protein UY35_C0007G0055 [Candidatus Saccharibacteria bacterium GW2011_GWC2_48_9]|nr:MAG: hypothetical protein UY35_C0007G0055 [Candidatus Saccharibacteria bacterium GW2011_GWC2_48_9]